MNKTNKNSHDYETLVRIKLAAEVLKNGFWMGDLVDFLKGHGVKIIGNQTNTSKWLLAKSSLDNISDKTNLQKIFKAILNNRNWYYPEPTEALDKLAQTIKSKRTLVPRGPSLSFVSLHSLVQNVSSKLFFDGHHSQAILEAYKVVINQVKSISNIDDLDGKPLMENVFSLNNPRIKLNKLQTQSEKDEQLGFMFLYSGAALGIRNPKAHDNIVQNDPVKTLEYLAFASLLLKRLDERIK